MRVLGLFILPLFVLSCASTLAPLVAPDVETNSAALKSGAYQLDQGHAALIFQIDHLGFSNYVGRFEKFDASLDFDPESPESAALDAIVEIASLDIANDAFAETLLGDDWFAAGTHPQARFQLTGVDVTGETSGVMRGDLTLHGVTAPIALNVQFNGGANDRLRGGRYVVGFSANGTIDRTVFGIDRFAGLVGNEVEISIEAEFIRQ